MSDVAGKLENVDILEENVETLLIEVCDTDNDTSGEGEKAEEFGGDDDNDNDNGVCDDKAGVAVDVIADVIEDPLVVDDDNEEADDNGDGSEEAK